MFYEIKIMIIEERLRDISREIAENKQKHQKSVVLPFEKTRSEKTIETHYHSLSLTVQEL